MNEKGKGFRRRLAEMIDPSVKPYESTIKDATVVDLRSNKVVGGKGTETITRETDNGAEVFVGVRIPASQTIISSPDRR